MDRKSEFEPRKDRYKEDQRIKEHKKQQERISAKFPQQGQNQNPKKFQSKLKQIREEENKNPNQNR
jgi:hypothetical protein